MYQATDIEKELSFIDIKIGIKSSLISLISVQLVFQILTLVYIQIISYPDNFIFPDYLND